MAKATTQKFSELILEVELDPVGAADTFTAICGMIDVSITRTASVDTAEVPDCDDESLPLSVEKEVRSIDVSASSSGVWALESNKAMMDWFYSSKSLVVRLRNAKVESDGATGDPYEETGPALLSQLNNARTKGQKVSAEIELQFDGTPTVGVKA